METNKILNADVLDIIFDGRNKQYGAYQLRKTYSRRLGIALSAMLCICLLAIVGSVLANDGNGKKKAQLIVEGEVTLSNAKDPVPPPPPPPKPQPKVQMINDAPPKIVIEKVPPLPSQKDMDDITLGPITQPGVKGLTEVAPPLLDAVTTGASELRHDDNIDKGTIVQVQAQFPGGIDAWKKYLERNLRQDVPADNGAPAGDYTVVVSFLVDRSGAVTEVKAENDPGYGAAAEAVRVIQKSGKWVPAVQNGRIVIYRQKQQVTFRISDGQ